MRLVGVVLVGLLTVSCQAQIKEFEDQKKSLAKLPPISYTELEQCVKTGEDRSAATTKFLTPGTGKKSSNPFSSATSFSWPEAGIYQEKQFSIFGNKWKSEEKSPGNRRFSMFDGTNFIDGSEYSGKRSLYYRDRAFEQPLLHTYFGLPEAITASMKVTGKSAHPEFGNLIHLAGSSEEMDIAVDRDYMIVSRKYGGTQEQVMKMSQIEGHWLPTLVKQSRHDGLDVYTMIKDVKILATADREFSIKPKPGDFVVKGNVYYDVDRTGKLVKSKNQPDRTTEYLSWAGMAALAIFILSVIVIGCMKLMQRPGSNQH